MNFRNFRFLYKVHYTQNGFQYTELCTYSEMEYLSRREGITIDRVEPLG